VPLDPEADTPFVLETVRNLVRELGDVPLIGFAGAPFTVASYLIEGRPSRTYENTKRLMYTEPELWFALLDRLADLALASLHSQVANGASRRAAVRLVGGRPLPQRLPPLRAARQSPRCSRASPPPACPASTSG
jgi:uroporphyrinogen-III decarboxylase